MRTGSLTPLVWAGGANFLSATARSTKVLPLEQAAREMSNGTNFRCRTWWSTSVCPRGNPCFSYPAKMEHSHSGMRATVCAGKSGSSSIRALAARARRPFVRIATSSWGGLPSVAHFASLRGGGITQPRIRRNPGVDHAAGRNDGHVNIIVIDGASRAVGHDSAKGQGGGKGVGRKKKVRGARTKTRSHCCATTSRVVGDFLGACRMQLDQEAWGLCFFFARVKSFSRYLRLVPGLGRLLESRRTFGVRADASRAPQCLFVPFLWTDLGKIPKK